MVPTTGVTVQTVATSEKTLTTSCTSAHVLHPTATRHDTRYVVAWMVLITNHSAALFLGG